MNSQLPERMKIQGLAPVFQVSSLDNSLTYYREVLGFMEDFRLHDYAGVRHGEVSLHLCGHKFHNRPVGGSAVSIFCDEIDSYYEQVKKGGALIKVEPDDRSYGMRDFTVVDPDGNHLYFGCESRKPRSPASN